MEESPKTSDIEYHLGSEQVAKIFETALMRHLVGLNFHTGRKLVLSVGKHEIELLVDSTMSSDCIKLSDGEGRILAQVVNVRINP